MTEIVLFHTAESNIGVFSEAAEAAGFQRPLRHVLRDDLLRDAEAAGGLTDAIRLRTTQAMAAEGAETIVCTCSTIGPGADDFAATGAQALRVDRALAEAALDGARKVAVLYAVATTEGPTRDLFHAVAAETGATATIEMIHVTGAWDLFRSGDPDGYFRRIADVIDALPDSYDRIALAQASMAPAAALTGRDVLTSPGVIFSRL